MTGTKDYANRLSLWRGKPVQSLIAKLGEPDRQFPINSQTEAFVYVRSSKDESFRLSNWWKSMTDFDYTPSDLYCQTTFSIRYGIVVDSSFSGDACY
jgi:hypothetical protein